MLQNAKIDNYPGNIRDLNQRILKAALKSNDLKNFLDEIVIIGAENTEAKSCDIFLLEESKDGNQKLRLYSTSREIDQKYKDAEYYIPQRKPFQKKGEGKRKVMDYLSKYLLQKLNYTPAELEKYKEELKKEDKNLLNIIWEKGKSLIDIVEEMGDDLPDLVEKGELPMGLTAYTVKTNQATPPLNGSQIWEHPEWRGSYWDLHEISTSLIQVPLQKKSNGKVVGMIKIENHLSSTPVSKLNATHESQVYCFTDYHKEILTTLADSIIIAIRKILYAYDTYKKIYGTKILKKINELEVISPEDNVKLYDKLKEFYSKLDIEIEDISGINRIYNKVTKLVNDIAQVLNLYGTLDLIDNIGPAFEPLLGTDIKYREHFIHQFQVFLLGYYLINKEPKLYQNLLNYLQKINPDYQMEDVLKLWFITAMFHDFSYSVAKMEGWLENYFSRFSFPTQFHINWNAIYTHYEIEKINLVELISSNSDKTKYEISNIIKDAFIEENDHGILSGLMLMKNVEGIDEILVREAGCAISMHTETVYEQLGKLHLNQFPFAFLLVFCDNVQEWGRPVMMNLIPHLNVKLEDILTYKDTIEIKLIYQKLTSEQKRIIETNIAPITKYWHSNSNLKFNIKLYEDSEQEPFRQYLFPYL